MMPRPLRTPVQLEKDLLESSGLPPVTFLPVNLRAVSEPSRPPGIRGPHLLPHFNVPTGAGSSPQKLDQLTTGRVLEIHGPKLSQRAGRRLVNKNPGWVSGSISQRSTVNCHYPE